jgi:glycosyltransferase involved in cell wall biosynthesis
MRLAFIRSETAHAVFEGSHTPIDTSLPERLRISAKAGSSSKNIIAELLHRGLIDDASEWKFWDGPNTRIESPGLLPVQVLTYGEDGSLPGVDTQVAQRGAPDILWVEGPHHPPYLQCLFERFPASFKLVYSKDWKPHKVERLGAYDLCLLDEESQSEAVHRVAPAVHAGVWDKLIDYEEAHRPLGLEKQYDVCYIAYLRPRKNHGLVLAEVARLLPRRVSVVFVGGDRNGTRARLEDQASELGIDVTFVDEASKAEVNEYVNRSRIGVMAAEKDAAPRVILEYLAADVPAVVNADLRAGCRYVDQRSGIVVAPDRLHEGIRDILDDPDRYSPRSAYLDRFSKNRVIERFISILCSAGLELHSGAPSR